MSRWRQRALCGLPVVALVLGVPSIGRGDGDSVVASFRLLRPDGSPAAGALWIFEPSGYSGSMPVRVADSDGVITLTVDLLLGLRALAWNAEASAGSTALMALDGITEATAADGDRSGYIAHIGLAIDFTSVPPRLSPNPHGRSYVMAARDNVIAPGDPDEIAAPYPVASFGT